MRDTCGIMTWCVCTLTHSKLRKCQDDILIFLKRHYVEISHFVIWRRDCLESPNFMKVQNGIDIKTGV